MEVIIVNDETAMDVVAADAIDRLVQSKPNAVLGIATGSSPLSVYAELARRVQEGTLSLKDCTAFMLDEYVGLRADHPQRYRNFIEHHFVRATDIDAAHVHGPDGLADDIPAACVAYEQAIKDAGGVDLQLLGVGTDGHIAFNEPGSSLASRTRIKTLTQQTRRDNARFFDGDMNQVPNHCLTQGIGTIMDARHLVLVANGRHKAEAISRVVEGPVTAMWTGSEIQHHPHATVIVDRAAASQLQLATYYEESYKSKPSWQRI